MNRSRHSKRQNYQTWIFWIAVFAGLFLFFQLKYAYFFYYIEQLQLFLFTGRFAKDILFEPGGLALYLSLFCVQFYIYPGVGALVTAGGLTAIGLLTQAVLHRLAPVRVTGLLSLLPVVALLALQVDMNYKIQGTIGLVVMLGGLLVFSGITEVYRRLAAGMIWVAVLFLLAGPVAFLFALLACLMEVMKSGLKGTLFLLLPLEMLLIAYSGLRLGWHGEWRMLLLPDFYYEHLLTEKSLLYSWYAMGGAFVLAWLFRNAKEPKKNIAVVALYAVPLLSLFAFLSFLGNKKEPVILKNMEQDYYVRREQWDRVIETFPRDTYNKQTINLLNLALAKKGQLGDRLFEYDQLGPQTVIADWDDTFPHAIALSEIYYHIGDIGAAQKLAFEGCVSSLFGGNVRLIQRLVETNLIYGAYPVAEKYIALLEHTFAYRHWAGEHRRYLYDEQAFSTGSLGEKRKSLVSDNQYVQSGDITRVLEQLSVNNPSNTLAMQYLAALYLVNKDLKNFKRLFETYAKTKAWPTLAVSHQEAIIALDQKNPFYWIQNGVTTKVEQRFRAFDNDMNYSRNQYNFAEKMRVDHGHTLWYYLLYKKIS